MPQTAQNVTPWEWTEARLLAAQLVAEDRLTDREIAATVEVHRKTLWLWQQREEFRVRVSEIRAALRESILTEGIAARDRRVAAYDRRWRKMEAVIDARAKDPAMAGVPGGATGLLSHDVKMIGGGEAAERVDVYEVDTGLLRELREVEKQAAQDLGQWTERREHTGKDGAELVVKVLAGGLMEDL